MPAISELVSFSRASVASYYGSDGLLKIAPNNTMRFAYDPSTKQPLGVQVEETRTNLMLQSENPGVTPYSNANVTVTTDAGIAPDGKTTANLITENTADGEHRVGQSTPTKAENVNFWNSVFIKKAPGSARNIVYVWCGTFTNHTIRTFAYLNLDTGELSGVGGAGAYEAFVQKLPNGWFRVFLKGQASGTGAVALQVSLSQGNGTNSYVGDGVSGIYVWGFQQEDGLSPTSYIPTTTAAVTRATDQITISNGWAMPWFNPTAGTFIVETMTTDATEGARLVDRASGNNGVLLSINASPTGRVAGQLPGLGGSVTYNARDNVARGSFDKIGYTYSLSDAAMSVAGLPAQTVSRSAASPAGTSGVVRFGWSSSLGATLNGYIKSIEYFPRRMPNSELQSLTAR